MASDKAPTDVRHGVFARVYPWIARQEERRGGSEHRRELLAGLSGRVVEVGAGHGINFRYYPDAVTELVAVEPEPRLRVLAEDAAVHASVRVRVVPGTATALPVDTDSCDAVVMSLVLCTVPDPDGAFAEARRVLRPSGQLRFYEHVRSVRGWAARLQATGDLVWPRLSGGCHLSRDTGGAIRRAGFEITSVRRFHFSGLPHVLGTAVPTGPNPASS